MHSRTEIAVPIGISVTLLALAAMALRPDGCDSASESAPTHEVAPGATDVGVPVHPAHRGQTTHPQCEPVDGLCRVRGLTTAPRLPPTA